MSTVKVPLFSATSQDAAPGTFGAATPLVQLPELKNYASDDVTKQFIQQELVPLLREAMDQRKALEDTWQAIDRMVRLQHDDNRRYVGRSNVYLPAYRKVLGTRVSNLSRGLFPSDEYLDLIPLDEQRREDGKAGKAYMQWELDVNARLRSHIKPFLRQFENYGTSCLKYWFETKLMPRGRSRQEKMLTQQLGTQYGMEQYNCSGLRVSPRNMNNVYVYPVTADSLAEATCVFEHINVPLEHVKRMGRDGRWLNIDDALRDDSDALAMEQHIIDVGGIPSVDGSMKGTPLGGRKFVTEVWCYMPLPKSAYLDFENEGDWVPAKVVLIGSTPVEVIRNPLFTQLPPFLFARQDCDPGFFYGSGTGAAARALQYLINDVVNQTNDCGSYTMNPMAILNVGAMAGPTPRVAPGAVFKTTDAQKAINFIRPPAELIQYGHQHFSAFIAYLQDMTGAPPVLQGSKAAGTATSTQILQNNAMTPLQDVVEDIELEVLVPLMQATWCLAQQFRQEQVIATVGGMPITIRPDQLTLKADFRWLASSQAANKAQRAQQAIQLIQATVPLVPLLAQQGKQVNFATLLERIFSDGFGFRGFSNFVQDVTAPAAQGMAPPGMAPGAPGAGAPAGDRVRSAVEQAGGMEGMMAPGEGEDFMQIRQMADQEAAQFGPLGQLGPALSEE